MTPEEARRILDYWIHKRVKLDNFTILPYKDAIIIDQDFFMENTNEVKQYTFKGLIKIAYEL